MGEGQRQLQLPLGVFPRKTKRPLRSDQTTKKDKLVFLMQAVLCVSNPVVATSCQVAGERAAGCSVRLQRVGTAVDPQPAHPTTMTSPRVILWGRWERVLCFRFQADA